MAKVGRNLPKPDDPLSIVQYLGDVQRVLDSEVEFGNPHHPTDDQSTARADGAVHNGVLQNIKGSWVEVEVDTAPGLGAAITCTHNLGVTVEAAGEPNVRWLVFGWSHDGTGAAATTNCTAWFQEGDTVGADAIELRFGSTLTVADATSLKVTLFFIPAVRMPA